MAAQERFGVTTYDMKQTWRRPWYFFCGNCTPSDSISCCTACWLPCVAYGWTTSTVFRTSFWREVGRCFLFLGIVSLLGRGLFLAQLKHHCVPWTSKAAAAAATHPTQICMTLTHAAQFVSFLGMACIFAWAVYVGGPRRTQLRKALGLSDPGSCCTCCYKGPDKAGRSDFCMHFCCLCCALSQEMRTVMQLKAANKLPQGPQAEGYEQLLLTEPPAVDDSMDRSKAVPVASMV